MFVNPFAVCLSCYYEDIHKGFESKKEQSTLDWLFGRNIFNNTELRVI